MTECNNKSEQKVFEFFKGKTLTVDRSGGQISSDAGLLTLKEFDRKIGYTKKINQLIQDPRNPVMIVHQQEELVTQRLYQIIAGYEDTNDATTLRHDPAFKVLVEKNPEDDPLGSQPTLSRFENRITEEDLKKLNKLALDSYIQSFKTTPKSITIEVDSTNMETHGQQQLSMFNGFYDHYVYHPLLFFDAASGHALNVALRSGNVASNTDMLITFQRLVRKIRSAFPKVKILLRADAGFEEPALYEYCEYSNIQYLVGIKAYSPFKCKSEKYLEKAIKTYKDTTSPVQQFNAIYHRAKKWSCQRRIIVKSECNGEGWTQRFVITNLSKVTPKAAYESYCQRGECENRIKEIKLGFSGRRMSCFSFNANYFRLLLHTLAYNLVNLFRQECLQGPNKSLQIGTLRAQLFKVGAQIKSTARRIWVHLSSHWVYWNLWNEACRGVKSFQAYRFS